jgi:hypothetical protein
MEIENDADLHGPYIRLELSEDVKTTHIRGGTIGGSVAPH